MANIRSFPNNQDEYIGAEDVMRWLHGRSSGVFGADGNASVAPVLDAMAITVSDGNGWISNDNADGVVWWIDNEETSGNKLQLEIDMADAVLPRIDRVVVSWQTTNYVALPEVKILKGTAASNPVAPALTNNNILRQISLASIRIPAGATAITSAMITDERLDDSVCGLVTNGIGVDTSVMQEQFSALLKSIKQELADLNNDTAALLKAGGTMYGDLDMGGNKIHNIPTPTDDNDPATKKYVDDGFVKIKRLWVTADASSEVAAHNMVVDWVSEYDIYFFVFRNTTTSANKTIAMCRRGDSMSAQSMLNLSSSVAVEFVQRIVTVSTNGYIGFSDATGKTASGDVKTNNKRLIPIEIYGLKGVIE